MPLNQSNANDQITPGVTAAEKVVTTNKENQVTALDVVALSIDGTAVQPKPATSLAGATITVGADAGTTVTVTIQFIDENGDDMAVAVAVPWYLSSDAAGQAISTAHDGGAAIGTDGLLIEWTANVAGLLISEADGDADIVFTDSGAFTAYLNLVMPDGSIVTSDVITHEA